MPKVRPFLFAFAPLALAAAQACWAQTLPTVTVSPDAETATGPAGFTAKRSATATKTDTPLIETPQAISVITREQMEAQGATQLRNTVAYSAGVVSSFFDSRIDSFKVRGSDPVQYLDGLIRQTGFYNTTRPDPYTLERVELLRGPSSVLYGQGGVGGVFGMVSKRPQAEAAREVQLQRGNFGRKQVAVDFTGPLDAQGQWLYRLVAVGRDSGTQVDHVPDDRMLLAPSLTWRPNADTSLNLQFHRQKDKSGSLIEFFPWQGTLLPSPFGQIPTNRFISEPGWDRYDTEQTSFGWQFSHRLNDRWTVRQNFRSTDASADYYTIYTSFTANAALGRPARPVFNADQQSVLRDIVVQLSGSKVRALDNQAEARFATGAAQHTLLLGADFQATETSQSTFRAVAPAINVYAPVYGNFTAPTVFTPQPGVQGRQTGLYAQDQIKWGRWVAQLGLRHDRATLDTEGRPALAADDKATTKRAGLVYLADGGFAPYVSYSESFLPLGGVNAYGEPYKPQRGKQWEAGLKWEPAGGRTTFMAAVYDLRDTNRRTADPANPLNNLQVGEIRARGYELEAKTQLTGGWSGSAGYAYTDARVSRSNGADQGKRLASVPTRTASLWVMRSMALGAGALSVGAGARYVSESWDGTDSLRTPPFTLLDAMVAWDAGPWRLALNLNNLTDKVHVTTCLARGDCFYGQRRTAVATLRYSY